MARSWERQCKRCAKVLNAEEHGPRASYCSATCRTQYSRDRRKARKEGAAKRALPEHIRAMKKIMGGEMDEIHPDVIREIYNEAVRENINQHVQDSVLGAVEIMTGMLPKALAALQKDLEAHDPMDRQRAYQVLFKYVMPIMNARADGPDLGKLTVIHEVPVPDTPLGEAFVDAVENPPPLPAEITLIECYACHEHKHPDAVNKHDSKNGSDRYICKSCYARKKYSQGQKGAGLSGLDLAEDLI